MRWLSRSVGAAAALGVGLWVSGQIWSQWRAIRTQHPVNRVVSPKVERVPAAPSALDQQISVLGTDASLSPQALRLVLVATQPGRSLSDSTATLGTDPRNPQTYAGGATLSNGARIADVQSDRIVLAQGGEKTTLLVNATTKFDAGAIAKVEAVGDASSREDLSEFLRPQPVFENEKLAGLKISAGTNVSRLASLGLEPGDVIRAVSGRPIDSESTWQEIDDVLSSGGSLVVDVERRGTRLSVSMDGARLAGTEPAT